MTSPTHNDDARAVSHFYRPLLLQHQPGKTPRISIKRPKTAAAAAIGGLTRCVRPPPSLPSFKITGGSGRTTLTWLQMIGIHSQALRAAGFAPFEARIDEDAVKTLLFCLFFDEAGARHDHGAHAIRNLSSGQKRAQNEGPRCANSCMIR